MRTRRDDSRAADAYARGLWVGTTLADGLHLAAAETPSRTLLVDGEVLVDCQSLHAKATTLAHTMTQRMALGSVVSFMLPNWHEAAVVYLAATLAGMAVNPILPSLRDHELRIILDDADSRMMFVPNTFRGHDYAAMLTRVAAALDTPPEVVVVRGGVDSAAHTPYESLFGNPVRP